LNLYAESSAVLSWLLSNKHADRVIESLDNAKLVFASDLTLAECDRALVRAIHTGELSEAVSANCVAQLAEAAKHWVLLRIDSEILERVRRPFPAEPIRTLDAIHLASVLAARRVVPDLVLLSLDRRVRRSGEQLGFGLAPDIRP
jgi:predicted nucleic acid-binding protein